MYAGEDSLEADFAKVNQQLASAGDLHAMQEVHRIFLDTLYKYGLLISEGFVKITIESYSHHHKNLFYDELSVIARELKDFSSMCNLSNNDLVLLKTIVSIHNDYVSRAINFSHAMLFLSTICNILDYGKYSSIHDRLIKITKNYLLLFSQQRITMRFWEKKWYRVYEIPQKNIIIPAIEKYSLLLSQRLNEFTGEAMQHFKQYFLSSGGGYLGTIPSSSQRQCVTQVVNGVGETRL